MTAQSADAYRLVVAAAQYIEHLTKGGELLRAGQVDEARKELRAAIKILPSDARAQNLLGLACFRLEEYPEALAIYRDLVEKVPDDPGLRLNLGLVHLKLGDPVEAIMELDKARNLDPNPRTLGYLALAFARNGEYDRAREAFLGAGQADLAREMEQHIKSDASNGVSVQAGGSKKTAGKKGKKGKGKGKGKLDGVPVVVGDEWDEGMVTKAVRIADLQVPPEALVGGGEGHEGPQELGEYATERLVKPDDGNLPFEIAAGGTLVIRVRGRLFARTEGVVVSGGELSYEPATRRVRGQLTDEPFGVDPRPMFIVSGHGHLVAAPRGGVFAALKLDSDVVYLREDLLFAFEESLSWEAGSVPGTYGAFSLVQFRGQGCLALRSKKPLIGVKLAHDKTLFVDAESLAGWIGRVLPRVALPAAGGEASAPFVECSGEGVVLIEDVDSAEGTHAAQDIGGDQ